jgi:hypothetical protein
VRFTKSKALDKESQLQGITEVHAAPIRSLYQQLHAVSDYGGKRGRRDEAAAVMGIVLLAKLAGAESVSGLADAVSVARFEGNR